MDRFLPPEHIRQKILGNRTVDDVAPSVDVTADTLADGLDVKGVKPGGFLGSMPISEGFRLNATNGLINMMGIKYGGEQQEAIVSEFAAKYLPATVDKFLELPPHSQYSEEVGRELLLHNAYYRAIYTVHHSHYFYKYLRSQNPIAVNNKNLPKAIAERLLALAPTWDHYFDHPPKDEPGMGYKHLATTVASLLLMILVVAAKDSDQEQVIPADIRNDLNPWLQKWATRYPNIDFGPACERLSKVLTGNKEFINDKALYVRRKMKNWEVCGMHGCEKTAGLKACSRCQTVQYCCVAHQKEHWKYPDIKLPLVGHKHHCFKTDY